MNRIFPGKYWADRIKQESSIIELWEVRIFEASAIQLLGLDLAEKLNYALKSVQIERNYNQPLKSKYPFWWSCIR